MNKPLKVALAGNPSVGKSTMFSRLTGIGVIISNYPGTTLEVRHAKVTHDEITLDLSDLPGIYSLDAVNMEERTVLDYLRDEKPDVILNVVDATRLERNLYLTLQLLELDIPLIMALNMSDEARSLGMDIDAGKLSSLLGVPVIVTAAQKGRGLDELMHAFGNLPDKEKRHVVRYDRHIEAYIEELRKEYMPLTRHEAIALLSGRVEPHHAPSLAIKTASMREDIESSHDMSMAEIMAANRYGETGLIARAVMVEKPSSRMTLKERLDRLMMSPVSGTLILMAIMLVMLMTVFYIGGFLEELIVGAFDRFILVPATAPLEPYPLVHTVVKYILIGVQAGLGIVVPYIMTFYAAMSILENTGYLTRAAFLLDDVMHRFRLHGRALIPMVLGFGCSVPAIMATKSLQTRRERVITSALVCMIPCSARSIVILGLVASFVSIPAALSIYVLMLIIIVCVGFILGRTVKGEETGFVLEMVPLRIPGVKDIIDKTWMQMREFIFVAFPLLIAGSALLGLLEYAGILNVLNGLLSPLTVGWMGLPDFTATALIFGILRKEMALETLAAMAGTASFSAVMTPLQMYVFAVFTAIYVPCLATLTMLVRVVGMKGAVTITVLTLLIAIVLSGLIAHLVPLISALI